MISPIFHVYYENILLYEISPTSDWYCYKPSAGSSTESYYICFVVFHQEYNVSSNSNIFNKRSHGRYIDAIWLVYMLTVIISVRKLTDMIKSFF